jgi:hypothetical protein
MEKKDHRSLGAIRPKPHTLVRITAVTTIRSVLAPRKAQVLGMAFLLGTLGAAGCGGGPLAKVTGRITCQGKGVVGVILFSPKGEGESITGPSVSATLNEDGSYELGLTRIGKYTVVVTPRDVVLRPKPGGFDYPCDRSPLEREIKAGDNDITIELAKRTR